MRCPTSEMRSARGAGGFRQSGRDEPGRVEAGQRGTSGEGSRESRGVGGALAGYLDLGTGPRWLPRARCGRTLRAARLCAVRR